MMFLYLNLTGVRSETLLCVVLEGMDRWHLLTYIWKTNWNQQSNREKCQLVMANGHTEHIHEYSWVWCLSPDPLATQIGFQSVFSVTRNGTHNDSVKSIVTEVHQSMEHRNVYQPLHRTNRRSSSALQCESGIVWRARWWISISHASILESRVTSIRLRCYHSNPCR